MSNQYPGPPGDLPPTQVAPGAGVPPQPPGHPQQPGYPQPGYPPQPPPYGAPGGGGGFPPGGGFPAPPTGGGGGKKLGLILGILGGVVLLVLILVAVLFWPIGLLTGDDDGDDKPKRTVTQTVTSSASATDPTTAPTTELTTTPTTELTTSPTGGTGPALDEAEFTAAAYLNSLAEGNCLAVQGLSTTEWWQSTYGSQRACERDAGNQEMSSVVYEDFGPPVENGDGSVTLTTTVSDSTDASGTTYRATWTLVPSDDGTVWLVDEFQLV